MFFSKNIGLGNLKMKPQDVSQDQLNNSGKYFSLRRGRGESTSCSSVASHVLGLLLMTGIIFSFSFMPNHF